MGIRGEIVEKEKYKDMGQVKNNPGTGKWNPLIEWFRELDSPYIVIREIYSPYRVV